VTFSNKVFSYVFYVTRLFTHAYGTFTETDE
jgi:hypothetical protein